MNAADRAQARMRLYALLSALVSEGGTASTVAVARELPDLRRLAEDDPDTLAAGHHAAFSLAFASAYVSPDGLVGGAEPDHLGALLAHAASRDATFLDQHLLSWLPLHVLAVRSTGEVAWIAVAELALELVASHRAELAGPRIASGPTAPRLDLDAPGTSLRTIASGLCRPAVSGWMPTGPAITRLAARVDLPGGFGNRTERMVGLLYSAADTGQLAALSQALDDGLRTWAADLAAIEDALTVPLDAWRARALETAASVLRLGSA